MLNVRPHISQRVRVRLLDTPTGMFALLEDGDGRLSSTWITDDNRSLLDDALQDACMHEHLVERVRGYFAGEDVDFSDVPTPDARGRHFFARCWEACRTIERGRTISYGELAERAGGPRSAARAAGGAMRNNPLPIIVPCHRVIASTGQLHGFSGSTDAGGEEVNRKRWLVEMEKGLGNRE